MYNIPKFICKNTSKFMHLNCCTAKADPQRGCEKNVKTKLFLLLSISVFYQGDQKRILWNTYPLGVGYTKKN